MRISELSRRSGVPVATIKYYLREEVLHAGRVLNPRQSDYDDSHVARLRLIRGLVHVMGASIDQVRQILTVIDTPDQTALEAMARVRSVAPVGPDEGAGAGPDGAEPGGAADLLQRLGVRFDPTSPYLHELDVALALAEDVGITLDDAQIAVYVTASRQIAQADFARIPWQDAKEAVQFAVLGTALYEPVLLALRRLAHDEQGLLLAAQPQNGDNTDDDEP